MKKFLPLFLLFHSLTCFASNSMPWFHVSTSINGDNGLLGNIFSFSTGSARNNAPPQPALDWYWPVSSAQVYIERLKFQLSSEESKKIWLLKELNKNHGAQPYINPLREKAESSFLDDWQEVYAEKFEDSSFLKKSQERVLSKINGEHDDYEDVDQDYQDISKKAYDESVDYASQNENQESGFALDLAQTILDVGISATPGISVGRDAYEAITGKHILTGVTLDAFDRGVAIAGAVSLGTTNLGIKGIAVIQKIATSAVAKEAVVISKEILQKYGTKGYREMVSFLKKYTPNIDQYESLYKKRRAVFASFSNFRKFTRSSAKETTWYRYADYDKFAEAYKNGTLDEFDTAFWFTSKKYDDMATAIQELALKDAPTHMVRLEFTIKKGSAHMEGGIAPKFGFPGGGDQYYLFDKLNSKRDRTTFQKLK